MYVFTCVCSEEFVAVWQWKPSGKVTEDEMTLKGDGILSLKSQGLGAAGIRRRKKA